MQLGASHAAGRASSRTVGTGDRQSWLDLLLEPCSLAIGKCHNFCKTVCLSCEGSTHDPLCAFTLSAQVRRMHVCAFLSCLDGASQSLSLTSACVQGPVITCSARPGGFLSPSPCKPLSAPPWGPSNSSHRGTYHPAAPGTACCEACTQPQRARGALLLPGWRHVHTVNVCVVLYVQCVLTVGPHGRLGHTCQTNAAPTPSCSTCHCSGTVCVRTRGKALTSPHLLPSLGSLARQCMRHGPEVQGRQRGFRFHPSATHPPRHWATCPDLNLRCWRMGRRC